MMQKEKQMHKVALLPGILCGILLVYFCAICLINFSGRPGFYVADMYTDILYALKAWEKKSIFPEGWIFGNQLYVMATPTLAALYNAVTAHPQRAMALAAVTMTIMIFLSFRWLLKPVISDRTAYLFCLVCFMTLTLYFGDSYGMLTGWQLYFTMCAYYACYLINALLAFGCYLRADAPVGKSFGIILAVTGMLSFAMGIQSLRQTAVMSGPLVCLAGLRFLQDLRRKENWKRRSLWVALGLSLCNFLGLVCKQLLPLEQTEIFGALAIASPADMPATAWEGMQTLVDLLTCETESARVVRVIVLLLSLASGVELVLQERKTPSRRGTLLVLLLLSLLMVFFIDVVTTMKVRNIYYFIFHVLIAWLLTCGFENRKNPGKWLALAVFVLSMVLPGMIALKDVCMQAYFAKYDKAYVVGNYLKEQGYTTAYARWNAGEGIAIASDFQVEMGFWDEDIFEPVPYLCDPAVYETDVDSSVYLFFGEESARLAEEKAAGQGVTLTLVAYSEEVDTYIYTASEHLMVSTKE